MRDPYVILPGDGPVMATALHAGHDLRDAVRRRLVLAEETRLLEEDPYTELLATGADSVVNVYRSRFEVDLNRPREKAVYRKPEDAWGLPLWDRPPEDELVRGSLRIYDAFYRDLETLLASRCERFGRAVVLDLHSYCHRRDGASAAPADPAANPEINVGTGSLPAEPWRPLVDRLLADLGSRGPQRHRLQVGENIRFRGGHFSQWAHARFPGRVCVLALEFKKFFMDEWTGRLDGPAFSRAHDALRAALPGLREELAKL
ncbi:MAG: N-formylglutamate amidohydrolase [Deferrisomatales bacterium]|nr:N-formylglutamate amidohydrolase [Deferrisomatales bacterium]